MKISCLVRILQKINLKNRCDHIVDCDDGTDEVNCTCKDYLQLELRDLICDDHVDCSDGTDEDDCGTLHSLVSLLCKTFMALWPGNWPDKSWLFCRLGIELCFRNEYRCGRSGTCIPATKRCDGISDCPAKEDEQQCCEYIYYASGGIKE